MNQWEVESNDQGRFPEAESIYDSDMHAAMAKNRKKKNHEAVAELEKNIALMKKWAKEGK